ncbi:MAG: triple tyrosine motif-containing protein [Ignavibacteria bacterium]|nr:triple tyrosine motif-containing protein [Ignavibacteria bacterium]
MNKLNRIKPRFPIYTNYDKNSSSPLFRNIISILEEKSGKILIASENGIYRFDPIKETLAHVLKHDAIQWVVKDHKEILWIGTEHGLYKYDGHHLSSVLDSNGKEFHESITCMYEGNNGLLWIGAGLGELLLFDTKTNQFTSIHKSNILQMNTVFEDSHGLVWAGMWDGGLICYDRTKDTIIHYISEWGKPAVLSSNHIMSIYEDKTGIMWFGANNGINKFDCSTGKFTLFTEYKGLNGVISILGDDHKNLWMSTRNGITKFNPVTIDVKHYEIKLELWVGCRTNDGEMYFGGPEGFTHFFPDSIKDNSFVPPIVITSIHKFNEPVQFTDKIDFPYTENFISFEFAALSYVSSEHNQYAYMMEGLDKDWIFSGTRHYASYPNLEPGEYIFRVKGSNNDGVWNEAGTSISIIITPPWWKTWWFLTFFWVTVAGSIGGTLRYVEKRKLQKKIERLERERAIEKERVRISQDMHDEVGSSLSEISILSELLKRDMGKSEKAETHLRDISERSAEVIENIGQII